MAIKYRQIPSATESELVLTSLQSYESGFYTCVLTNDCGTVTTTAAELSVLNGEDYCEIYVTTFQELFDVSGISGTKDIILCPGTYTMTDNLTVPSTKTLRFLRGAIIATTGYIFTCNGVIQAGRQQIFSGTGTVNLKETVNPFWFGAVGDGTTNDTTAIQAAINSVTTNGGTVYFPTPARYNIQSEITISTNYPVNLISDMIVGNSSGTYPNASAFHVGAAISGSIFKYTINNGGCIFRGLYFKDPTGNVNTGAQGTRAITSAIEITKMYGGVIENCAFDSLLGSAIKTSTCNRTKVEFPHIRNCGTPTKPVIWLTGSDVATSSQAIVIVAPHIEVCYGDYIYLDEHSYSNKIINGQFEADTDIALSSRTYIYNKGSKNNISNCGFNRNDEKHVYLAEGTAIVSNCIFSIGSVTNNQLYIAPACYYNVITGNRFIGAAYDSGTTINDLGGHNTFTGNRLHYCGNVVLGAYSSWQGDCYDLKSTEAYAITTTSYNTVNGSIITGCDTSGGILVAGNSVVTGNIIKSNTGIGIYNTSSSSIINGNLSVSNTGGDFTCTAYPHGLSPDDNIANDAAYPLYYSGTWNPAEIANGASESKDVTVTGAAVGDEAVATFPMLVSSSAQAGMVINATVVGTNTVKVVIGNLSGGAVNLDSGTLYVKVTKK